MVEILVLETGDYNMSEKIIRTLKLGFRLYFKLDEISK